MNLHVYYIHTSTFILDNLALRAELNLMQVFTHTTNYLGIGVDVASYYTNGVLFYHAEVIF